MAPGKYAKNCSTKVLTNTVATTTITTGGKPTTIRPMYNGTGGEK